MPRHLNRDIAVTLVFLLQHHKDYVIWTFEIAMANVGMNYGNMYNPKCTEANFLKVTIYSYFLKILDEQVQ